MGKGSVSRLLDLTFWILAVSQKRFVHFLLVHSDQWSPKHPGRQAFYREVIVWKSLKHPNIVPFLGVPTKVPPPFEIVCEWMENSRITEYVRENPNVDRIGLVSGFSFAVTTPFERQILQLWDVADGLHYLHSRDVIHGDLKGVSHSVLHLQFSRS
jgi:serine/threonine protein kinase